MEGAVRSVVSSGGYLFTAGDDGVVKQWSLALGNNIRNFQGHARPVTSLSLGGATL